VALVAFASSTLAQDDYLKALEAEASKLSPGATAQGGESAGNNPASTATAGQGVTFEQFETLLQDNYRGTYVFYKELPSHTREEMFVEYQRGVSIRDLRDKIMDRYLQR